MAPNTKSRLSRAQRQIREDARALGAINRAARHAALTEEQKVERLGHSIVAAVVERGRFEIADGVRAGFGESDAKRLFEQGVAAARLIEPRLDQMLEQMAAA